MGVQQNGATTMRGQASADKEQVMMQTRTRRGVVYRMFCVPLLSQYWGLRLPAQYTVYT
jgi:hypothetical protein